jgi:hypothetical protein
MLGVLRPGATRLGEGSCEFMLFIESVLRGPRPRYRSLECHTSGILMRLKYALGPQEVSLAFYHFARPVFRPSEKERRR